MGGSAQNWHLWEARCRTDISLRSVHRRAPRRVTFCIESLTRSVLYRDSKSGQFRTEALTDATSVPSLSLRLVLSQASHWGQLHDEKLSTSLSLRLVLYQASAQFLNILLSTLTQLVGTEATSRMPERIFKFHYFLLSLHLDWQIDKPSKDRCGGGRRLSIFILRTTLVVRWDVAESFNFSWMSYG